MIHPMHKECGLTMISWLLILSMIGFFVMVGLKVVPVYMQHYTIKNVVESLEQEPLISRKPVGEIRKMLMNRLDVNHVRNINRDHINIRRTGGITTVEISYEERRPIAGNLDVIMSFNESIQLIAN